jgi:hypothetical protein
VPLEIDGTKLRAQVGTTDAQRRLLHAIRCIESCRGLLVALVLIEMALECYFRSSGHQRVELWLGVCTDLIERVETLEEAGATGFRTPSPGEEAAVYRRLVSTSRGALDPEIRERTLCQLAILVVDACSRHAGMDEPTIEAWSTLHQGNFRRAGTANDWIAFAASVPFELKQLNTSLSTATTPGLQNLIGGLVEALGRPIAEPADQPDAGSGPAAEDTVSEATESETADFEDDSEDADEDDPRSRTSKRKKKRGPLNTHQARENPVAWRIKSDNFATHIQRFDLIGDRDRLDPLSTQAHWRSLKRAFREDSDEARKQVAFAHVSQRAAAPARIALDLRLDSSRSTRLDIPRGELVWNYRAALDKTADPALSAIGHDAEQFCIRLVLDADVADYLRLCLLERPSAATLAELLNIKVADEPRKVWLRRYRKFLRDHGDSVHPAYDARFATSLADVYRHLGAQEVLAVFLALDFTAVPMGMLNYITLLGETLASADAELFRFLDWRLPHMRDVPLEQGSPISLTRHDFKEGWAKCQERTSKARAALLNAATPQEFTRSFNQLSRLRLLTFITLTGHRGSRLSRLTRRSLYMCETLIHLHDKDVGAYQSDRCIPVTSLVDQVLAAWQSDMHIMRRRAKELGWSLDIDGRRAIPAPKEDGPAFFELRNCSAALVPVLERKVLRASSVAEEAKECFDQPLNIGRHFLVSQLIERKVSAWFVRVLTGHRREHAEVFADGLHIPPAVAMRVLKDEMEALFSSLELAPVAGLSTGQLTRDLIEVRGDLPNPHADAYLNPSLASAYRVLPPPFDAFTTLSERVTSQLRVELCDINELTPEGEFTAAQTIFATLDLIDQERIFESLGDSVRQVGKVAAAVWTRPGCSQSIAMRLNDRSVIALARVKSRADAGTWRSSAEEVGRWVRGRLPALPWPADDFDAFQCLAALALRWRRVHYSPANLTAANPAVPAATFSARSLLRAAGILKCEVATSTLGKALRKGVSRVIKEGEGPLYDVAAKLREVSGPRDPLGGERQRARDWEESLKGIDLHSDTRALALKLIHDAEIALLVSDDKDADKTGTLAGHLSEILIALELLSPMDDFSQMPADEIREWVSEAKGAIDEQKSNTKAVKTNAVRYFGLKRFLRIGRSLGWSVPTGLFKDDSPRISFDGMRKSAASVALLKADFDAIRALLLDHFEDWPVLQDLAKLATTLHEHLPLRSTEQAALVAQSLIRVSKFLLIAPGKFSHLKSDHAYRMIACAAALVKCIERILDNTERPIGEYFFLDDEGWDWSVPCQVDEALVSAAAQVTGEASVRKHSLRASAVCRLVWACWEEVVRELFDNTWSPKKYRERLDQEWARGFSTVALAARSAGHGLPLVSLVYYAAAWPLIFCAQGQALLEDLEPTGRLISRVLDGTGTIRTRRTEALKEGRPFDTWGEVARRCLKAIDLPPLESTDELAILVPRPDSEDVVAPPLASQVRLVAGMIASGDRDTLADGLGIPGPYAQACQRRLPGTESRKAISRRRGGEATPEQLSLDLAFMQSKEGLHLLAHLLSVPEHDLETLLTDLAPYRQNPRHPPPSASELRRRLSSHLRAVPPNLRLQVRFSEKYPQPLTADQLAPLGPRLVVGSANPRIGRHPQFQVFPAKRVCDATTESTVAAPPIDREILDAEMVGRLTVVTRIYLESIQIVQRKNEGELS